MLLTDSKWFSKDANADDAVTKNSNIYYLMFYSDFVCVIMTAELNDSQLAFIVDILFPLIH